ncbi:MAG TPA: hypothetical protein VG650_09780 [Mycobacteriales bacterium]|nr:hypothetical protein [Mycobacteriales bacterium]
MSEFLWGDGIMRRPYRRSIVAVEGFMAMAGAIGAAQLIAGVATPPRDSLPFGWSDWTLPGLWLIATVAVPSLVASVAALRGSRLMPPAVLAASGLLGVELLVQIPYVGLSWLQLVCGLVAVTMVAAALRARSRGW